MHPAPDHEDEPMTIRDAIPTMFPPLHARKHPGLAAVVGVVTGGLGLAVYFRSLRDLFPVEKPGATRSAEASSALSGSCPDARSTARTMLW